MISTPQYFECHITVEPVFGDRLEEFQRLCKPFRFKVAKLVMVKDRTDMGERSDKDSFCTGHGRTYDDIDSRMYDLIKALEDHGFHVWRYKIEHVILDVKCERKAA